MIGLTKIQSDNPVIAASQLHNLIGWDSPTDYTLEEIANSIGLIIKKVSISGSDGRILINGDTGIISINSNINYAPRINFIIAHEIGHFILHKELGILFSDTVKSLSEWYKKGPHEQQANEFASELLMPELLFRYMVNGKPLNIDLIIELSNYFQVSRMAACLRYITHGEYPAMLVFIEYGMIKWKYCSNDFPFPFLRNGTKVPALSVAGDYFYQNRLEEKPEVVDAIEWFPEDFNIKHQTDFKLWEQCYKVSDNGVVSFLWTK